MYSALHFICVYKIYISFQYHTEFEVQKNQEQTYKTLFLYACSFSIVVL